ncbi:hypothetical protein [Streptomyces sp. NBC_01216]|uniref:hypothetical protein n=1 Tax=unclassified Streptomyces TaxID=2593676 RepID=UPI002E0D80A9|nr:hypothetical protein OG393_21505 [Streptomyces sp. NBC_01216]
MSADHRLPTAEVAPVAATVARTGHGTGTGRGAGPYGGRVSAGSGAGLPVDDGSTMV